MAENVLFLCTHNACRSQMAEALLRKRAGDRFDAHSAGLEPTEVDPMAVRVLEERGLDVSRQRAKGVGEFLGKMPVHYMIVVCAKAADACPTVWPGAFERLFWPFDDPAAFEGPEEQKLEKFRAVRDEIDARLEQWLAELDAEENEDE